jgi:putative sensory box protein
MEALLNEAFGLEDREQVAALLPRLREIAIHYAKKGDLLYPHLKVKYDISGPSQVMWTIDDEIRNEMGILARKSVHDDLWWGRLQAVLTRAKEMIYKENNILLPICAANFTQAEWQHIYRDGKDYAVCLGVELLVWAEAERNETPNGREGEIVMPGGHLTLAQLTAMLNTIPLEITFVDADNINRYFNEGPKVLKRPSMAIDREVFSCHPPKIEPMVRSIIDDLRSGKRDQVQMWMEKLGRTMLVNYMAVRDKAGNYVGTVEVVQDMEFAKQHFLR